MVCRVAQLVRAVGTNPCVGGSSPPTATNKMFIWIILTACGHGWWLVANIGNVMLDINSTVHWMSLRENVSSRRMAVKS